MMISENIARLRQERHWSQTLLAKKLRVSCKTIKNWEASISDPSADNIIELAKVFSVTTDMLLGINASSIIILDSLSRKDQRILRAIFQAYISNCEKVCIF